MKNFLIPALCLSLIALNGCSLFEDLIATSTPTKTKMEGVWEVTAAYDDEGKWILDSISSFITLIDLQKDNSVISTAGPMFMYIVYGKSRFNKIMSTIDQVFDYAEANFFTNGEWNAGSGNTDYFTVEIKLKLPGQKSLTSLLEAMGINSKALGLDQTIYHKFMGVKVSFEEDSDLKMIWDFDFNTSAEYNIKNEELKYVLWEGVSARNFTRCKFVLTKRVKGFTEIIRDTRN